MLNYIEITNEISLLIGSYMLVEFTDYESNGEFKYQVGWFMTGLMILTTLTNVSCMIYTLISVLKEKVKSAFNNWQK